MNTVKQVWTFLGQEKVIAATAFASGFLYTPAKSSFNINIGTDKTSINIGNDTTKPLYEDEHIKIQQNNDNDFFKCPMLSHPLPVLFSGGLGGFFTLFGSYVVAFVLPTSVVPVIPLFLGATIIDSGRKLVNIHMKKDKVN